MVKTGAKVNSIIFKKTINAFQYSLCSGIKSPISNGRNRPKHHACEAIKMRTYRLILQKYSYVYSYSYAYTVVYMQTICIIHISITYMIVL